LHFRVESTEAKYPSTIQNEGVMKTKLQNRHFNLRYKQSIGSNILIAILILGLLAFSTSATALPNRLHGSYKKVLGENPVHAKLITIFRHKKLQARTVTTPQPSLLTTGDTYKVRIVYMIPSNRLPQPDSVQQLKNFVIRMRAWYGEEMARLGYGFKTFNYETDVDGTPKVNFAELKPPFILTPIPDAYFKDSYLNIWSKILDSINAVGFTPWKEGELLLVVAETHNQYPDGHLDGSFVGGAGDDFSGVGIVTGESLARFSTALLIDNRLYNGLIMPTIGAYQLVQDVTFPWFEGTTVSSSSSSAQGAALHEFGHGLGLQHDFRNDANFNGNSSGNGLRGVRGTLYPNDYPADDTRLASSSALRLNSNRFFNSQKIFTENNPPLVNILTQANPLVSNGQCPIRFSASDTESKLTGALLIKDDKVVADMPLTASTVTATMSTYDYVPGENNEWLVQVFDAQGNSSLSSPVILACNASGRNRAPQPYVKVSKRKLLVGEAVVLDASLSTDPGGSASRMTVSWDLNGDGIFDTSSSRTKTYTTTYRTQGYYQIVARLTDTNGATSKSMPFGIKVGN
jgi:hypothetical protein